MKKYLLIFAFIMPLLSYAQPFEAELLGHWSNDDLIPTSWLDSRYNDVWGTVQNGQEFAIFGSTEGVHFIDVTDPTNPTEVAFVEAAAIGNQLVHRDYHTYNGYLYTVADEGPSTLQVIDMHDLPNSVDLVYDSNEFMTRSHNIFVDSLNAVLYSCGGDSGNSLRLLSLADPTTPTFLTEYSFNTPFSIPQVHDIYVRDHIGYLNCGNFGFFIIDFSNPTDPVLLGTMTDYPQKGYNHSGWLANDEQHYYMCDETHGMDVKVVDVSDPSDLNVVNLFSAESTPNQIAHNAIVRDNYLYISYYYDGVQVFDITDPANPVRFSYFDTFDGANDSFYQGAWGVYPFLPSGNILISDMNNGLYVVNPFSQGFTLSGVPSSVDICTKNDINFADNNGLRT
jgi:choice-of-anchor B domain-containing protein